MIPPPAIFRAIKLRFRFLLVLLLNIYPVCAQNGLHSPEKILSFGKHIYEMGFHDKAKMEFERLKGTVLFDEKTQFYLDLCRIELEDSLAFIDYRYSPHLQYAIDKKRFESGGMIFIPPAAIQKGDANELSLNNLKLKILSDIRNKEFDDEDKNSIHLFGGEGSEFLLENLMERVNPSTKSPLFAGILSAVMPGLGRVYTGNYGDAAASLFITGIFAYLAYSNFFDGHYQRAWIFAGIAAFFQGGNIYGSVASAKIYNESQRELTEKKFWEYYEKSKPLKQPYKIVEDE